MGTCLGANSRERSPQEGVGQIYKLEVRKRGRVKKLEVGAPKPGIMVGPPALRRGSCARRLGCVRIELPSMASHGAELATVRLCILLYTDGHLGLRKFRPNIGTGWESNPRPLSKKPDALNVGQSRSSHKSAHMYMYTRSHTPMCRICGQTVRCRANSGRRLPECGQMRRIFAKQNGTEEAGFGPGGANLAPNIGAELLRAWRGLCFGGICVAHFAARPQPWVAPMGYSPSGHS